MNQDIERILFSEAAIRERCIELGREISADHPDGELVLIALLKGSVLFYADLIRTIDRQIGVEFAWASSYGDGTVSRGAVDLKVFPDEDLSGKTVILVDDILDTGLTMASVKARLQSDHPGTVIKTCVLLDKEARRAVELQADYIGFKVEDVFVVGYGLDFAGRYRNLPYIGVLKERCYQDGAK